MLKPIKAIAIIKKEIERQKSWIADEKERMECYKQDIMDIKLDIELRMSSIKEFQGSIDKLEKK